MIKSMTGYGSGKSSCQGLEISIEIKSVNNRYLDCNVRLPRNLLFAEEIIKARVQEHVSRAKADVFVAVDSTAADDIIVRVNENLAKGYIDAVSALAEKYGLQNDMTALAAARFPDVLSIEKKETDRELISAAVEQAAELALEEYDAMRSREGEKLCQDVEGRLSRIEELVSSVEKRSPETVEEYRTKLTKRMQDVLETSGIDEQRILTEAAIFADKIAVDEETVRLRSHISQMRDMLKTGSPIGRKMDFLIQEFNREANTIGSKCSDGEIAKTVIEIKSEIEKIREQIQNIE